MKEKIADRNNALTDPKKLIRVELRNAGFDIDKIKIPDRVYLLADDIFDEMVSRNVGEYRYPLGGKLYVFNKNENIGFIKGHMCSPAIAIQAEDLIAGGVKELIHVGYAGGLRPENVWQQVYMLFLMCIQRMIGNLDGKAMILKSCWCCY